jgi:hypothetical protein
MILSRKLLTLALGLPVVVAAADPDMLRLIMPDASGVVEINIARVAHSPIGSAIADGIRQGMTSQMQADLAKSRPELRAQLMAISNIDWIRDVQDVLIAGGPTVAGKPWSGLMIVRSSLDPSRIEALKGVTDARTEYEGVPILVSAKPGNGVIAFLDNSIVVLGQMSDVEAAIHRRREGTEMSAALSAQMAKYSQYDIWLAATGIRIPPAAVPAAKSAPNALAMQYFEKLTDLNLGLRLSPDFDLSATLEARTEKAATELAQAIQWLSGTARQQAKLAGKGGAGLDSLKCELNGRRILLSLHVPEEQFRAGLAQMRAAQPRAASPNLPSRPPAGTISVQSSEGTVIIPLDKQQQ